jgi:hypothetical protein
MNEEEPLKEFIPKYEKPKILLLDLPEETLPLVQSAGFNAVSGSFGTPYDVSVKPDNGYFPVIPNDNLPEDYTEKEVIIIDLTVPEKKIVYPGDIGIAGNEDRWWIQCKQDTIDPRLVQMKEVKNNFDRILTHGGFFIIFARPRFSQALYKARDNSIDTSWPEIFNNWNFLSILSSFSINEDSGKEIYVLDGDSEILQFFSKNIEGSYYTATLSVRPVDIPSGIVWTHILKNKFDQYVGGLMEIENSKGHILILPQISNKPEFVLALLNEILPVISPDIFPDAESKKWINNDEYQPDSIIKLKEEKIEIQKKAQEEIDKLDKLIENERNKFGFLRDILTSTGQELVVNIKKCLEFIGFEKVIDVDEKIQNGDVDTQKQEDLQISDKSPTLLIEVKGLTGVPQEADIMQVIKYVNRRMKGWNRTDIRGVSIINYKRNLPPLDRGDAFTPQQEKDAKGYDIAILTSWDLFLLIKGAMKLGWDHKIIREFFYRTGRISHIPSIYKPLGKVFHYWDKEGVVGVEIAENELHKGQCIGYITPTGYLEEKVISLQIDNEDVEKASPGQKVGIKTLYSKKQLHKANVYIVTESKENI